MSQRRPGEHATRIARRLLTHLATPQSIKHDLLKLVNSLELAKSQLKAHLVERKEEIRQLQAHAASQSDDHSLELAQVRTGHAMDVKTLKDELAQAHAEHALETKRLENELEQARRGYSGDDDLVKLYHAGATVITKQAAEIKKLQAESQRGKDEQERQSKDFTLKAKEEKAVLVEAVQQLESRIALLTTESMDAEKALKRQISDARGQLKDATTHSSKLEYNLFAANKTIDVLRRVESVEGEKADLLNRLRRVEQHCEGYRTTATDQQKIIEKLSKENTKLVVDFGRLHLHHK